MFYVAWALGSRRSCKCKFDVLSPHKVVVANMLVNRRTSKDKDKGQRLKKTDWTVFFKLRLPFHQLGRQTYRPLAAKCSTANRLLCSSTTWCWAGSSKWVYQEFYESNFTLQWTKLWCIITLRATSTAKANILLFNAPLCSPASHFLGLADSKKWVYWKKFNRAGIYIVGMSLFSLYINLYKPIFTSQSCYSDNASKELCAYSPSVLD